MGRKAGRARLHEMCTLVSDRIPPPRRRPERFARASPGYSGKLSGREAYVHIELGSMRMKTTPSPHSNGLQP